HQHGAQKHKVAELRMNQISMDTHMAEPRRNANGFMRNDPEASAASLVHLHREAHGRIGGANSTRLKFSDDCRRNVIDFVAGPMKLEVRYGTRSAANRLASHPDNEAQQRFRPRIIPENLCPLRFEGGAPEFNDANIVRPAI